MCYVCKKLSEVGENGNIIGDFFYKSMLCNLDGKIFLSKYHIYVFCVKYAIIIIIIIIIISIFV